MLSTHLISRLARLTFGIRSMIVANAIRFVEAVPQAAVSRHYQTR
jgi:hypothetical protein